MLTVDPTMQMWMTFLVIVIAIVSYALEKVPLELTSVGVVVALLMLFYLVPLTGPDGAIILTSRELLAGFADPSLFAIIALLVIGQALVQTGALDDFAEFLMGRKTSGGRAPAGAMITIALLIVTIVSAFMNNTPVVVIFIPIVSALAARLGRTVSHVMIPLSYAAILGGNMTLIGSSTNLLVAGTLESETGLTLSFFDFTVPGAVLAGVGLLYVIFVAPRLLHDRASIASKIVGTTGKQFIVQIQISADGSLMGQQAVAGLFPGLPDLTVRMLQRGGKALLPPYDEITLQTGDVLNVAATRTALTKLLATSPDLFEGAATPHEDNQTLAERMTEQDRMLAEAMITPASRMDGRTLAQLAFRDQTNCVVIGVQRRSRMIRERLTKIRMEAGDVLLLIGKRDDLLGLRSSRDILLLEWSATDLVKSSHARRALMVFAGVVALAASGLIPIAVAALTGVFAMIAGGCLNIRQAGRAVDRRIVMMIGSALAMGTALNATGGAAYLAHGLIGALEGAPVPLVLSAFFLLVAMLTNVLSNAATAVLFTPIAVSVAGDLSVDPMIFVVAVIFAANCSFATPMGYQTNLLVMGPGHYKFSDYLRVGIPLIAIIWVTYTIFAPWYYGLM